MSGLIKAADAGAVHRFEQAARRDPVATPATAQPTKSTTELALDDARKEIAGLQAQLLCAEETHRIEREEAFAAGRADGLKNARRDDERRLAVAQDVAEKALIAWRARLSELDALAATLARGVVAKVFSPDADIADLMGRAIAAKIEQLHRDSVVAVRVSGEDFDSLSATDNRQVPGIDLVIDPALAAGECRIDLRLGQIDLSMERLGQDLDGFLQTLAHEP